MAPNKIEWNPHAINMLIEIYKQHDNLYDPKSKQYFDKSSRCKSLNEIVNKLRTVFCNIKVSDIKSKIGTLRSQYLLYLKKRERRQGEMKAFPYETIKFLKPYLKTARGLQEQNTTINHDLQIGSIICRTCGNVVGNRNAKHLFEFENLELLKNIQLVVGIGLLNDPELPNQICEYCLSDLKQAVIHMNLFRERCLKAQETFQSTQLISGTSWETDLINSDHKLSNFSEIITKEEVQFDYDDDFENHNQLEKVETVEDWPEDLSETQLYQDNSTISLYDLEPDDDGVSLEEFQMISDDHNSSSTFIESMVETSKDGTEYEYDSNNYQLHFQHNEINNFQCNVCSKEFYTEYLLLMHARNVHRQDRNYICKLCDRTFQKTSTLLRHERSHCAERVYSCDYCDKTFTSSFVRNTHLLTHNSVRPYFCNVCDRDFQRNARFQAHLNTKEHVWKLANKELETIT